MKGTKAPKLEFNVKPQKAYLLGDFWFIDLQYTLTPSWRPYYRQSDEAARYGVDPVKRAPSSRNEREKFIWNLLGLPEEMGRSNRWRAIAILPRALIPSGGRIQASGGLRVRLKGPRKRFSAKKPPSMKRGS